VRLIDGRAHAKELEAEVAATAAELRASGTEPTLAVVVPTDDDSTAWYVRSIERTAARVGIACRVIDLAGADIATIRQELRRLSADDSVHAIVCQTPLPEGASLADLGADIAPAKDVDGANPLSLGRLAAGLPAFPPATAAAVTYLLGREQVPLAGAEVVVIGRSTVVGKPAALLLLGANATVTVCHSRTADLAAVCARADVLVAAVGRTAMVTADFVKPGAVVIDVGTNPTSDGGLAGDVDAAAVAERAGALTPVPGGVGPVTTMLLMGHVLAAASPR
jgi:methylenetetrahydrofolate dehydrogenase (NADP+)/methenyltetrahydrofolate cyclohydrolase